MARGLFARNTETIVCEPPTSPDMNYGKYC